MKKIVLLIFLTTASCVTEITEQFKEAAEFVGYRDLGYWVRFGNKVMVMSERQVSRERAQRLKKSSNHDWVRSFELALVIGLRPMAETDYYKAVSALDRLSKSPDLDSDSKLAVKWYLHSFKANKKLFEVAEKHRKESEELNEKLQALSTIEQKIP